MWNSVSWNPTMKQVKLFTKVVSKHEHSNYMDPLASIPMRDKIVQELGDIVGTIFMRHAFLSPISRVN